jgi:hypothetical protein
VLTWWLATASAGFSADGVVLTAEPTAAEAYAASVKTAKDAYDAALADEKNKARKEGCATSAKFTAAADFTEDASDATEEKKAENKKANADALAKFEKETTAATGCLTGAAGGNKTILIVVVIAVALAVAAAAVFMCKKKPEEGAEEEGGDDDLYFANDVEQSLN